MIAFRIRLALKVIGLIFGFIVRIYISIYLAPGAKTKVKTLLTLAGAPLKITGLKTHLRAASTAAFRSAKWPLMATASTTSPPCEMVTCTSTVPVAFIIFAPGG